MESETDRPGSGVALGRRLLRGAGVDFRPGEALPATLLFLCFFLLIAFQYSAKSVRQSTFIDSLGFGALPYVYLLVAICSYPFLRLYGRIADRLPRHHLMMATSSFIAGSLVLFWWLYQFGWPWVAVLFYIWISIVVVMTVSQFWSFANHVLDARQAKRLFGFIGAGGLLGGIAGGQVARLATDLVGTRYALLVAATLLLGVGVIILLIHRLLPAEDAHEGGAAGLAKLDRARGGFQAIKDSRHLRLVAGLMLVTVMVAQIVDLQFNWAVEQMTTTLDQRTAFFGNFYSIMGISALAFQLIFTSRIHRLLGVGVAMRVLPVTMGLGTVTLFLAATTFPASLAMAALVLKVGENGLRYSLDQATRELLFMPVPAAVRAKAKAFIDVFVQRGAKGLAALVLLPVTFGLLSAVQAGAVSIVLIVGWVVLTFALQKEYVHSFRRGLRRHELDADVPINLADVTTIELLVQSLGSADPRQVLNSLEILESHGRGRLVPPLLLYHDDPEVRLRTLALLARARRHDSLHLIERRLADEDPEVRSAAVNVLAELQGRATTELMLPRINDPDPGVRAAAITCLANHGEDGRERIASMVLGEMLSDSNPRIRVEAAKALGAIAEPMFQEQLVRLLYDSHPDVVCGAVSAVRRRAARDGFNPLYGPSLVALLSKRRLKHDAREAIVALGEPIVPALLHFMADSDEQIWVRRAIPKTLAAIESSSAVDGLGASLASAGDRFLRRKIIESLAGLSPTARHAVPTELIEEQIGREARGFFRALAFLEALGLSRHGRLVGVKIVWNADHAPSLIERLLAERKESHVDDLFRLLSCLEPAQPVRDAYRALVATGGTARSNAIEYLDNTLSGEVKRYVLSVVGDDPARIRIETAKRWLDRMPQDAANALAQLLTTIDDESLIAAALYEIHTSRLEALMPLTETLTSDSSTPFVRETAVWVRARWQEQQRSTVSFEEEP